jgi:NAD(P)-dependent dehydrogenase (short-subunit alcohol dehydrogenase family)
MSILFNPMQLNDKKILVVGALSGVGKETVQVLDSLGAKVILVDESIELLQTFVSSLNNNQHTYYSFDPYNTSEIEQNIKKIVADNGSINSFAYCAGIGGVKPLLFTTTPFFQNMMNANLYSFVEFVRCVTRKGSFIQGGSIVVMSSVSSLKGLKSKTAYCASKAALNAAVKCLAAELSGKKIRVNSIVKGGVETDMQKDFLKNIMTIDENNDMEKQILGITKPNEIANMIAFLLSDATSTITGTALVIDGGYTL